MRLAAVFSVLSGLASLFLAFTQPVAAAPRGKIHVAGMVPHASAIQVGSATSTPYGWLDFCNRYEAECAGGLSSPVDVKLSPKTWKVIAEINSKVNASVEPLSDLEHWGVVDRWDLPEDGYGDCEDYVLLKRKLLIAAGLPRQGLLVTVVKDEKGEGHAVLTVKTDHGEFVLDNMRDSIRPWSELPYRFVKRQSQEDPNLWVQIGEPTDAPLTVAR
jgi:predicted transglutaminase-like cysteine proteinase